MFLLSCLLLLLQDCSDGLPPSSSPPLSSVWTPLTGAFAGLLTALWLQPLCLPLAFFLG